MSQTSNWCNGVDCEAFKIRVNAILKKIGYKKREMLKNYLEKNRVKFSRNDVLIGIVLELLNDK